MADDELKQMQQEWRQGITNNIGQIFTALHEITTAIGDLRTDLANTGDVDGLRNRVSELEKDRAKLIGAFVVLQIVGGIAMWALSHLMK